MIAATSNAVNLTDGLDGLATGACTVVFAAYTVMNIWQNNQSCELTPGNTCYEVRDPLDLAIVSAALTGACFGFLWWNASPAKIFMGDTGSLALGGALGTVAVLIKREFWLLLVGGVFAVEALSVMIQVDSFTLFRRRVFKMSPIHHHFELSGWAEGRIVLRFYIAGALLALLSLSTLKLQ